MTVKKAVFGFLLAVAVAVTVCEVHHVALHDATAPIAYGCPKVDSAYQAARDKAFPHSSERVLGGCGVRAAKTATIPVCPQCDAAKADWLKRHPGTVDASL